MKHNPHQRSAGRARSLITRGRVEGLVGADLRTTMAALDKVLSERGPSQKAAAEPGRTSMADVLECPECSEELAEADEDGLFFDTAEAPCPACGTICRVVVYEDDGATVSSDGFVADEGQPRCDGSGRYCTTPTGEHAGQGCWWTCPRAETWRVSRPDLFPCGVARRRRYTAALYAWQEPGRPIEPGYTEVTLGASLGDFHTGTCFEVDLWLDDEQADDLELSLGRGLRPVFWISKIKEAGDG